MGDFLRIGGIQYGWNSGYTRIDGQLWRGVTSVEWGEKLDTEWVRGDTQDGVPIGLAEGEYEVDTFTIRMLHECAEQLTTYLAFAAPGFGLAGRDLPGNFGRTSFLFQQQYSEALQIGALPIILNAFECRIVTHKHTREQGTNTAVREFGLKVRQLQINGKTLYRIPPPSL